MDIAKIRKKIKEKREGENEKEKSQEELRKTAPVADKIIDEKITKKEKEKIQCVQKDSASESPVAMALSELPEMPAQTIRQEGCLKPSEPELKTEELLELLTFQLATEEFAFKVSNIEEILRQQRITIVPNMPEYILGITSLRGKIIPVIDLKKRIHVAGGIDIAEERRKIIILKGHKGPFGALIDKVKAVIRVLPSEIDEPPAHLTETELMLIEGVILYDKRFVSVIRMEEILDLKI